MPTITKQFSFNSSLEGWTFNAGGGTSVTGSRNTTEDSPNDPNDGYGCLGATRTGKNRTDGNPYWEWYGRWEDLGVPTDAVVTAATLSYDWRCSQYTTGTTSYTGPAELRDASGNLIGTFSSSQSFTSTTSWSTRSGSQVSGLSHNPSTYVRLRVGAKPCTGGYSSAVVTLLQDWITVDVAYDVVAQLSGTAAGLSSCSASIGASRSVSGECQGTSFGSATISLLVPVAGEASGYAQATSSIYTVLEIAGESTSSSTCEGDLAVSQAIQYVDRLVYGSVACEVASAVDSSASCAREAQLHAYSSAVGLGELVHLPSPGLVGFQRLLSAFGTAETDAIPGINRLVDPLAATFSSSADSGGLQMAEDSIVNSVSLYSAYREYQLQGLVSSGYLATLQIDRQYAIALQSLPDAQSWLAKSKSFPLSLHSSGSLQGLVSLQSVVQLLSTSSYQLANELQRQDGIMVSIAEALCLHGLVGIQAEGIIQLLVDLSRVNAIQSSDSGLVQILENLIKQSGIRVYDHLLIAVQDSAMRIIVPAGKPSMERATRGGTAKRIFAGRSIADKPRTSKV